MVELDVLPGNLPHSFSGSGWFWLERLAEFHVCDIGYLLHLVLL